MRFGKNQIHATVLELLHWNKQPDKVLIATVNSTGKSNQNRKHLNMGTKRRVASFFFSKRRVASFLFCKQFFCQLPYELQIRRCRVLVTSFVQKSNRNSPKGGTWPRYFFFRCSKNRRNISSFFFLLLWRFETDENI